MLQEDRDHVAVRVLCAARDVVGLAGDAVAKDEVDGAGVIRDVEPVAPLEPVPIHRELPIVDGVGDEQRDELLGVVIRPVRVRTASHDGVQAMGDDVAPDKKLAGGLGGGVG